MLRYFDPKIFDPEKLTSAKSAVVESAGVWLIPSRVSSSTSKIQNERVPSHEQHTQKMPVELHLQPALPAMLFADYCYGRRG